MQRISCDSFATTQVSSPRKRNKKQLAQVCSEWEAGSRASTRSLLYVVCCAPGSGCSAEKSFHCPGFLAITCGAVCLNGGPRRGNARYRIIFAFQMRRIFEIETWGGTRSDNGVEERLCSSVGTKVMVIFADGTDNSGSVFGNIQLFCSTSVYEHFEST